MGSPKQSRRTGRTAIFLCVAILANSFGNLLLALAMDRLPAFAQVPFQTYLLHLARDPYLLPGVVLTAVYALVQLSLFSWADLSFVVPCIASSYAISTLLGEFVLGERVRLVSWMGVGLILLGVVLVARTPVATKKHAAAEPPPGMAT